MRYGAQMLLHILLTPVLSGQLFLGVFSGPVEGILSVVLLYTITGFTGRSKYIC